VKKSLIVLLLIFATAGCDQVIQRLSNKNPTSSTVPSHKASQQTSEENPKPTELEKGREEKEGQDKPASVTEDRGGTYEPKIDHAQRDQHKKQQTRNEEISASKIDRSEKSNNERAETIKRKSSTENDTEPSSVRRGNVSLEY